MSLRIEKRDVAWETRIKDERTSGFFLWLQHLEVASTHAAKILSRRSVKRVISFVLLIACARFTLLTDLTKKSITRPDVEDRKV